MNPGNAMKHLILIAACALGLAGCSSHYIIATIDGQLITTDDKPHLDKSSGMYQFEDSEGKDQMIPQSQVKQIMER